MLRIVEIPTKAAQMMTSSVERKYSLVDSLAYRNQVLEAASSGFVVDGDMELAREDEDPDAGKHSKSHRRRNGAKILAPFQQACDELQQSHQENNWPQHLNSMFLNEFVDDHRQPHRRAAHLQRRARQRSDHGPTDDPRYQSECRRNSDQPTDVPASLLHR